MIKVIVHEDKQKTTAIFYDDAQPIRNAMVEKTRIGVFSVGGVTDIIRDDYIGPSEDEAQSAVLRRLGKKR